MRRIMFITIGVFITLNTFAQYSSTYTDIYGQSTGSAETYYYGNNKSTTYKDIYGRSTGSAETSYYGNSSSTTYKDVYGRSTGYSETVKITMEVLLLHIKTYMEGPQEQKHQDNK